MVEEALKHFQNQGRIPAHQGRITRGRQLREPLADIPGIPDGTTKVEAALDIAFDEQAVPVSD
jgi:hypothetical protein